MYIYIYIYIYICTYICKHTDFGLSLVRDSAICLLIQCNPIDTFDILRIFMVSKTYLHTNKDFVKVQISVQCEPVRFISCLAYNSYYFFYLYNLLIFICLNCFVFKWCLSTIV